MIIQTFTHGFGPGADFHHPHPNLYQNAVRFPKRNWIDFQSKQINQNWGFPSPSIKILSLNFLIFIFILLFF